MQSRIVCLLLVALAAGCGGDDAPASDSEAVAAVLRDAAKAVADRDGDKACSYLTADAQRQAQLQLGAGVLGQVDCPTAVNRATLVLTPLERDQLKALQPANVQLNGTSASATLVFRDAALRINLQKAGDDWKISGFS